MPRIDSSLYGSDRAPIVQRSIQGGYNSPQIAVPDHFSTCLHLDKTLRGLPLAALGLITGLCFSPLSEIWHAVPFLKCGILCHNVSRTVVGNDWRAGSHHALFR